MAAEESSVKRLTAVTEKLKKIEADRAWNLSTEGKAANKRLKELQQRIKKEDKLLDKQAAAADKEQDYKDKSEDRAAELARLEDQIRENRSAAAKKDRKEEAKFQKKEAKLQQKLQNEQRNFSKEFYDSIFGTYSLIGSLKDMFPKPVQILAGWGFDKIKKGISSGVKGIGKLAKGGFNAMMGRKPDGDASPEVKAAAEDVAPADAAVPKRKSGGIQGWMQMLGNKGGKEGEGDAADVVEEVIPLAGIAGDAGDSMEELKKQTALLKIIADEGDDEPDASKSGESILESGGDKGSGKGSKLGGKFGKMLGPLFKAFKSIWKMVKVFLKWKTVVIVAILALVGWLTVKFWEPIKASIIKVVDWFKGLWQLATDAISGAWTGLQEFIQDVWNKVTGWFTKLWEWGAKTGEAISAGWTSLKAKVKEAWDAIVTWFTEKWSWAKDVAIGTWTSLKDKVQEAWDGITTWFKEKWSWAKDVAVGTWTSVKDKVQGVYDSTTTWFSDKWKWASDVAVGTWTGVKDFIKGKWDAIVGWFTGLWKWGVEAGKTPGGEKWSLTTMIDKVFTSVKDWALSIFSWATGPVKPEDSWIKKTINAVITKVQTWALSLFAWAEEPGESWISTTVKNVIKTVKSWVTGLFTWVSTAGKVEGEEWSLSTMVKAVFKKAKDWVVGLFKWGQKAGTIDGKEWSLLTMISSAVDSIFEWFKGVFEIDFKAIMDKMIPDWAPTWFKDALLGKTVNDAVAEHGQTLKAAKKAGLYDEDSLGASEINREALTEGVKTGQVQKEMLQAIIDDKDLRDEDLQFMKQLVKQATTPGSLYVHDTELANILRRGFGISKGDTNITPNNQLTPGNDIAAASANMYSGGGGGTNLVNAPMTTNSSSSTIVNVQTPRMATDPNTQKQSGYALSGWAKFD